jgi:choline dehydrogenase-like flavoprotein
VLANRLSANGSRRVLLIEAGQDTLPGTVVGDGAFYKSIAVEQFDLNLSTGRYRATT